MMRSISSEEVRRHDRIEKEVWISIQGNVYDVTEWIKHHPGGDLPLLDLAGQDVTDAFMAYHPVSAWKVLQRFHVGNLQDYSVSDLSRDYRKLLQDLKLSGMFRRRPSVYIPTLLAMLALLGSCILGVLCSDCIWVHLFSAILLGFFWSQSAFIGHDSGHCDLTGNATVDKYVQLLAGNGLTGISIGWWKRNHNVHHIACNSLEYDPDVQYVPIFAVNSGFFGSLYSYFYGRRMHFDKVARWFVSYQHWTFYPIMAIARVNLFYQSWALVLNTGKRVPFRALEIVGMLIFWTWFPLLVSRLPADSRTLFVLSSFAVCGIQHVQFCLNHFPAEMYVGRPASKSWFESQTKGTIDIACPAWMDWFHGGLQFQVEHHLFPRLPRCNLRKIRPLVQALCKKHGLPYNSVGFWKANAMTLGTLRAAAMEARDVSKPFKADLLWEALNAQG